MVLIFIVPRVLMEALDVCSAVYVGVAVVDVVVQLVMNVGSSVPSPFRFQGAELRRCKISMSNSSLHVYRHVECDSTYVVRVSNM